MSATMFDRIWDPHVVADIGNGWSLLHCDRVLVHDLSGGRALEELAGCPIAIVSTGPDRDANIVLQDPFA